MGIQALRKCAHGCRRYMEATSCGRACLLLLQLQNVAGAAHVARRQLSATESGGGVIRSMIDSIIGHGVVVEEHHACRYEQGSL